MTALFRFKPAGAKRRRSSNKSLPPRQASADNVAVARLAHAQNGQEADRGGGGDVIADPGDPARRLENLGQRRRKRGAENAASRAKSNSAKLSKVQSSLGGVSLRRERPNCGWNEIALWPDDLLLRTSPP
jgi:hypothetical protein